MQNNFKKILIVTKAESDLANIAGEKMAKFFEKLDVGVLTNKNLNAENSKTIDLKDIEIIDIDLIFAVGGDGTTLRTFRMLQKSIPVFSVNIGGNRGILADTTEKTIEEQLHEIIEGKYYYDHRMRLQAKIGKKVQTSPALNDIVISRTNLTRTPLITITISTESVSQKMDGIILSTPTGSTGHSLSMGGPIIHEKMECMMIMPIAPVNRMPSLILNAQELSITSSFESRIVIDGQEVYESLSEDVITITRHPVDALFLRLGRRGIKQLEKVGF